MAIPLPRGSVARSHAPADHHLRAPVGQRGHRERGCLTLGVGVGQVQNRFASWQHLRSPVDPFAVALLDRGSWRSSAGGNPEQAMTICAGEDVAIFRPACRSVNCSAQGNHCSAFHRNLEHPSTVAEADPLAVR
jgi:hypothetical protein